MLVAKLSDSIGKVSFASFLTLRDRYNRPHTTPAALTVWEQERDRHNASTGPESEPLSPPPIATGPKPYAIVCIQLSAGLAVLSLLRSRPRTCLETSSRTLVPS
jgi:hypothetical protein